MSFVVVRIALHRESVQAGQTSDAFAIAERHIGFSLELETYFQSVRAGNEAMEALILDRQVASSKLSARFGTQPAHISDASWIDAILIDW